MICKHINFTKIFSSSNKIIFLLETVILVILSEQSNQLSKASTFSFLPLLSPTLIPLHPREIALNATATLFAIETWIIIWKTWLEIVQLAQDNLLSGKEWVGVWTPWFASQMESNLGQARGPNSQVGFLPCRQVGLMLHKGVNRILF